MSGEHTPAFTKDEMKVIRRAMRIASDELIDSLEDDFDEDAANKLIASIERKLGGARA